MDDDTSEVLSVLRHDLNNARSIVGGLEAVLEARDDPELLEDAEAVQGMLAQVSDLIDVLTGVPLGGTEPVALSALCVRAARLGNIELSPPDDGGATSAAEPRSLELALRELIRNASFSGEPHVEIERREAVAIVVSPVVAGTPRHAFARLVAEAVAQRHGGTFTLTDGRAVLSLG